MNGIFFKKLEDNYLQIYFINNKYKFAKVLFFDSWYFTFKKPKEIYWDGFTSMIINNINFQIDEIRSRNDDVFFILLNDHTIIQISMSLNLEQETSQNIYLFEKNSESYNSAYSRFINFKLYVFDNHIN